MDRIYLTITKKSDMKTFINPPTRGFKLLSPNVYLKFVDVSVILQPFKKNRICKMLYVKKEKEKENICINPIKDKSIYFYTLPTAAVIGEQHNICLDDERLCSFIYTGENWVKVVNSY